MIKKEYLNRTILILLLISLICMGCSNFRTTTPSAMYKTITLPVGSSYPPISTDSDLAFSLEKLENLGISLVRIGSDWAYREAVRGEYEWGSMDERINALYGNGFSILFTIPASGPDWVCENRTDNDTCVFTDEAAFREYVTALVNRYEGKIDKYQFGNEWDNVNWYPGSSEEYVRFNNILYSVVQEISPDTLVVLGGLTAAYPIYKNVCVNEMELSFDMLEIKNGVDLKERIEQQVCSQSELITRVDYVLEYADFDIVDLHLYDVSEYWPLFTDVIKEKTDKPLIVSEFGGPSSSFEKYSQAYQAERLEKYLITLQELPIEEAYHFNLVDNPGTYHNHSGLFTFFRQKKQAYDVMDNMLNDPD